MNPSKDGLWSYFDNESLSFCNSSHEETLELNVSRNLDVVYEQSVELPERRQNWSVF